MMGVRRRCSTSFMRGLISAVKEGCDDMIIKWNRLFVRLRVIYCGDTPKRGEKIVRVFSRVSCDGLNFGEGSRALVEQQHK